MIGGVSDLKLLAVAALQHSGPCLVERAGPYGSPASDNRFGKADLVVGVVCSDTINQLQGFAHRALLICVGSVMSQRAGCGVVAIWFWMGYYG
ncbi:hypothetical protein D3C77_635180 [compost metagenome]